MEDPQAISAPVRDLELETDFIQVGSDGGSHANATEAQYRLDTDAQPSLQLAGLYAYCHLPGG